MADSRITKERFAQLVRAGFPVNPVSGMEIVGANLTRLQRAMSMFAWDDPRFVSEAEAQRQGWVIEPDVLSVQTTARNPTTGEFAHVPLFNAQNVKGMPALETMLKMTEAELAMLQGHEAADLGGGELRIGPARARQVMQDVDASKRGAGIGGKGGGQEVPMLPPATEASGRFAVMAPYWLDGLHNAEGMALAAELNAVVAQSGLARDQAAIARLLKSKDKAWMFELRVVPEEWLANDDVLRRNPAEPESLVGGALVRDKHGAYRPKAGGLAVVEDKGDSVVVKGKSEQGYKAAIELAVAKGWTAIELSGKGPMMADAWLEAKMQDLDVVNYTPTKEDEKRLAERMAKANMGKTPLGGRVAEQTPEIVELRPFVDASGHAKTAMVSYTVTREGTVDAGFDNAKDAAQCFVNTSLSRAPAVIRSVIRADGQVEADVMVAGTGIDKASGGLQRSADIALDREFSAALSEVMAEERTQADLAMAGAPIRAEMYSGLILRIEGNQVVQKIGRDPEKVVKHDISKLSRMPVVGEVEDIKFGKDGLGVVAEKRRELERQ